MAKTSDSQHSIRQYSTFTLWIGLISVLLLLLVLLESICIGILYIHDYLKGYSDVSTFAKEHLLTKLFVPFPPAGERVLCQQALSAKQKRSALRVTTRQGLLQMVDGGLFSKAKTDRSTCKVRLFALGRGPYPKA